MRAGYKAETRAWAIETYGKSRPNYGSRAECVAVIATEIGAHENTVLRWIRDEFGPSRAPANDDITAKLDAALAENTRLRRENRTLSERLAALTPRSITADVLGAVAL